MARLSDLSGRDASFRGGTSFSSGQAACQALKGDDMAVVSFVTNTLVDECGSVLADELDAKITEVLVKYVEAIRAIPDTVTIIFLYPFPRVEPAWVFESLALIHNKLDGLLDELGSNIHRFPYRSVSRDDFETDLTHLKPGICLGQFKDFCANYIRVFKPTEDYVMDEFDLISPSRNETPSTVVQTAVTQTSVIPPVTPSGSQVGPGDGSRRINQWGNTLPQLTPNSERYSPRQGSLKRPATSKNQSYGAKNTRLNNGQALSRNDLGSDGVGQQRTNNWNSNPTANYGNYNANGVGGDQRVLNPAPAGANRNQRGSDQYGQGRGRGGGSASGSRGWDNIPPGPRREIPTTASMESRMARVELSNARVETEMVANYELTETALNKINAASVIIDCLPFGRTNSNDPPVRIVRELVVSLGGSESHVAQAYFLSGDPSPSRGSFAKIRAIFSSEKSAFDFRFEATAARRRSEHPWENAFVSNDPTKGTRVRIEVLQQLAKVARATVEGKSADILVSKFEPRPMLLFKCGGKVYKRLVYSEALSRYGRLVGPQAFELARRIAGREYEGRMGVVFGI